MDPQDNPSNPDPSPQTPEPSPSPDTDPQAAMAAGIASTQEGEPPADPPPEEPPADLEGDAGAMAAETPPADGEVSDEALLRLLKGGASERFESLTAQVKELAPIREALDKIGMKLEDLPKLQERAKNADELIAMVHETGATAQQYGDALEYLKMVNAAGRGDRAAAEAAYGVMQREMQVLARALGKDVPGVHDPLAAHSDLMQAVEAGSVSRDYALEVAQARAAQQMGQQFQQRQQNEQQLQQAQHQASSQLNALDAHLSQTDPNYAARRPALLQMAERIRATTPPQQWMQAVQQAYQSLALIQVAPPVATPAAKPPVGPVPLRPTGARSGLIPQTDDPHEAMRMGIAAAHG